MDSDRPEPEALSRADVDSEREAIIKLPPLRRSKRFQVSIESASDEDEVVFRRVAEGVELQIPEGFDREEYVAYDDEF